MRKLGWVGGLGPGATVHYYKELVKRKAGEAVMIHADMAHGLRLVQALNDSAASPATRTEDFISRIPKTVSPHLPKDCGRTVERRSILRRWRQAILNVSPLNFRRGGTVLTRR